MVPVCFSLVPVALGECACIHSSLDMLPERPNSAPTTCKSCINYINIFLENAIYIFY